MSEATYDHTGSSFKDCLANPFGPVGAKYPGEFSHQYSNLLGGHSDHYVGYPGKENISATPGKDLFDTRIVLSVPQWLDSLSGQSKAGVTAGYVQQVSSDGWAKKLKMKNTIPLQDLFQVEENGSSTLQEYGDNGWETSNVVAQHKYLDCTRVKQYLGGDISAQHVTPMNPPVTGPVQPDGDMMLGINETTQFIRNAPIEVLRYTKFGIKITTDTPKEMVGGHYWYALVNGSEPANLCEVDAAGHLNLMTQEQCIESIVATRGWKKVSAGDGPLHIVLNPMERRSMMYSQALTASANDTRALHTANDFFPECADVDRVSKLNHLTSSDEASKARTAMGLWQKLILYSTARNTAFGTTNAKIYVPLSIEFYYCVEYVPPIGTLAHLSATPPAGRSKHFGSIQGDGFGGGSGRRLATQGGRRPSAPARRTNMAAIASQAAQLALPHLISFAAGKLRNTQPNAVASNGKSKKKKKQPTQQKRGQQPKARGNGRR